MIHEQSVDLQELTLPERRRRTLRRGGKPGGGAWAWVAVGVLVIVLAVVFVLATGVRPAYDAYGWLDWGRQASRLNLNTNAAPSWKPLTFLFTFPYALIVGRSAIWVWMVTSVAAGFSAAVFGGRIAYRLAGTREARRAPRVVGALAAGAGVLGLEGYWHFLLIFTADPMMVALALASLDLALSRRPRWAWLMLVLLCLGRPEAAPLVLGYAVWSFHRDRGMWPWLLTGIAVIPLLWFGIPALTSPSWLIAGNVLGASTNPLSGNKVMAILRGFVSLYELPMQLAVLLALALAVVTRERAWLLATAAALSWLVVDVLLALHGWGIAPRYMFEPASVLVVLAGAAIGRLLARDISRLFILRFLGVVAVIALVAAMVSPARLRARLFHNGIQLGQRWARQIHRLHTVIARDGGRARILACGQAVTTVPYQSIVAWELDENVANVGWSPRAWTRADKPIVVFAPVGAGWKIQTIHSAAGQSASCRRLQTTTPTH